MANADVIHAKHLARSLVAAHGENAVAIAERALDNVRSLTMQAPIAQWQMVIDVLKTAQIGEA
jgi:hypothetical protein